MRKILLIILLLSLCFGCYGRSLRRGYTFEQGWHAVCYPEDTARYGDSIVIDNLAIPHNFDDYYSTSPLRQGHLHGTAVYDFDFSLLPSGHPEDLFYRLRLDGAGTYVSIIVNDDTICARKPVGRVSASFDLDADSLYLENNHLRIICYHPSHIEDMPWVCTGCSNDSLSGFCGEPFGLFRPVTLEERFNLHVQTHGVHVWSNTTCDTLFVETEVGNTESQAVYNLRLLTTLKAEVPVADDSSRTVAVSVAFDRKKFKLGYGKTTTILQAIPLKDKVHRWSPRDPFMYQIQSELYCWCTEERDMINCDRVVTEFGFRHLLWGDQLKIDGVPIELNGVRDAEYAFGYNSALRDNEIDCRSILTSTMGYNAFWDAHHPLNLRYCRDWNILGVVYAAQFSSHEWHDTPAFRENYKQLLRQWVKERRNDPSLVLWVLQDAPTLPKDFAAECCSVIREMDPLSMGRRISMDGSDVEAFSGRFERMLYAYDGSGLFAPWGQPSDTAKLLLNDSSLQIKEGSMAAHLLKDVPGMTYLYRYNCGGNRLVDSWGQTWMGDDTLYTKSWAQRDCFAQCAINPLTASCGETDGKVSVAFSDQNIQGLPASDQPLVRTFRWGRQSLQFTFPVDSGKLYSIDLYLIEPWVAMTNGRLYDIAVNGKVVDQLRDVVSITGGRNRLVRTTIRYYCEDQDCLQISFPNVYSGQVVVSAIAISTLDNY